MNDPWRFLAFPVAAVAGYLLSLGLSTQFQAVTGLGKITADIVLVSIVGFIAGFMVDEVIPAYIEKKRGGGFGGSGGDIGGGMDDEDLDFD